MVDHIDQETVDLLIRVFIREGMVNAEEVAILRSLDTTHINAVDYMNVVQYYLKKWGKGGVPKKRKYDGQFRR